MPPAAGASLASKMLSALQLGEPKVCPAAESQPAAEITPESVLQMTAPAPGAVRPQQFKLGQRAAAAAS